VDPIEQGPSLVNGVDLVRPKDGSVDVMSGPEVLNFGGEGGINGEDEGCPGLSLIGFTGSHSIIWLAVRSAPADQVTE
jgi:hypothetical protein